MIEAAEVKFHAHPKIALIQPSRVSTVRCMMLGLRAFVVGLGVHISIDGPRICCLTMSFNELGMARFLVVGAGPRSIKDGVI